MQDKPRSPSKARDRLLQGLGIVFLLGLLVGFVPDAWWDSMPKWLVWGLLTLGAFTGICMVLDGLLMWARSMRGEDDDQA